MTTRRLGVAVAVLGGYLYAIGGSDGQCLGEYSKTCIQKISSYHLNLTKCYIYSNINLQNVYFLVTFTT